MTTTIQPDRPRLSVRQLTTALDGTAILPLINSLNHLNYLTSTSPRIREMVSVDGGINRLVRILQAVPRRPASALQPPSLKELQVNWKWSLAFQCAVNIGVRGSEAIRTRVVEAGMIPVVLRILESYLYAAQLLQDKQLRAVLLAGARSAQEMRRTEYPMREEPTERAPSACESVASATPSSPNSTDNSCGQSTREASTQFLPGTIDAHACASASASVSDFADEDDADAEVRSSDLAIKATPRARDREPMDVDSSTAQTPRARPQSAPAREPEPPESPSPEMPQVYREEEVLLSLQLLAYLSKYPHVRYFFHNADVHGDLFFNPMWQEDSLPNRPWSPEDPVRHNVFSIAERFTLRPSRSHGVLCMLFPRLGPEIQYWAGVVMRNACRKDESRGGIRQCANMYCGRWESFPREFAKCRRCRKAKYCSKQCQSKGWQTGHRYWCSARTEDDDSKRLNRAAPEPRGSVPMAEVPTVVPQPVERTHAPPAPPTSMPAAEPLRPRYPSTLRPPDGPALPSALRVASQNPGLRGVSTASVETIDPSDASDDNMRQSLDVTMADVPQQTDTAGRPLPPPMIVGGLESETHTNNELLDDNAGLEAPGTIDFMTTQWLRNVPQDPLPGPSVPSVQPRHQPSLLDLDIDDLGAEHTPRAWLRPQPRDDTPAYLDGILRTGARTVLPDHWGSGADVSMSGAGM